GRSSGMADRGITTASAGTIRRRPDAISALIPSRWYLRQSEHARTCATHANGWSCQFLGTPGTVSSAIGVSFGVEQRQGVLLPCVPPAVRGEQVRCAAHLVRGGLTEQLPQGVHLGFEREPGGVSVLQFTEQVGSVGSGSVT